MGKAKSGKFGGETKVRLPLEILDKIDRIAGEEYTTRSELIRQACIEYIRKYYAASGGDNVPSRPFPKEAEQPDPSYNIHPKDTKVRKLPKDKLN